MNEKPTPSGAIPEAKQSSAMSRTIGTKAARKLKARSNPSPGVWYGLGMMGLIGWSVAIPTLLGAALGLWLDRQQISDRSWTLALLFVGLTVGCLNAWLWVAKEDKSMRDEEESRSEESS
jgi:ATP synthase protein I